MLGPYTTKAMNSAATMRIMAFAMTGSGTGLRQSRLVAHDHLEGAAALSAVTSLAAAIMAVVAMSSACFTSLSP